MIHLTFAQYEALKIKAGQRYDLLKALSRIATDPKKPGDLRGAPAMRQYARDVVELAKSEVA